jgi:dihydrofolate reductase
VFVLTHRPRPVLEMAGGTTFHFLAATPREALDLATEAAGGKDVRIGGGPTVVREFLKAGLVDRLHVAIVPILLGRGIRLWDDLRGLEDGYSVTSEVAPSGTTHLTFSR